MGVSSWSQCPSESGIDIPDIAAAERPDVQTCFAFTSQDWKRADSLTVRRYNTCGPQVSTGDPTSPQERHIAPIQEVVGLGMRFTPFSMVSGSWVADVGLWRDG